jgi:hypothetical protein
MLGFVAFQMRSPPASGVFADCDFSAPPRVRPWLCGKRNIRRPNGVCRNWSPCARLVGDDKGRQVSGRESKRRHQEDQNLAHRHDRTTVLFSSSNAPSFRPSCHGPTALICQSNRVRLSYSFAQELTHFLHLLAGKMNLNQESVWANPCLHEVESILFGPELETIRSHIILYQGIKESVLCMGMID